MSLRSKPKSMFWTYILHCADGSYYTGHTDNLEMRVAHHHAGDIPGYTKTRRPVKLVWSQGFVTREEALTAEQQIKGWSRKKKESMICGDWAEVSCLAKSKTGRPGHVEVAHVAKSKTVRPEPVEGRAVLRPHVTEPEKRNDFPIMVGIGCDRNTSLETLQEALNKALQQCGLELSAVAGLASIDKKNDEAGLLQLAEKYAWPLHFYPAEELAQIPVPNPSEVVLKYMGTPAVAEAAALKAASTDMNHLLLEKLKHLGADGKNATVSIARMQ